MDFLLLAHNSLICEHLSDRAQGYGMESHIIDGNNIFRSLYKITRNSFQMFVSIPVLY